jgi:hypothetical protein
VAPPNRPKGAAKKRPPAKKAAARKAPAKKRIAAQPTRQEKEARALRNRIIIGGVLLVLAGAVVFAAARPGGGPSVSDQLETGAGACVYDTERDGTSREQSDHVDSPTYEVDPPAGGSTSRRQPTRASTGRASRCRPTANWSTRRSTAS